MIAAIHQPQFLPWLGYIDKIDRADVFILLDNVQYKKNEWQNRNRIKTVNGWQWITVPVLYRFPEKINEVKINSRVDWGRKHRTAMETNYGRAPFFKKYFPFFEEIYKKRWDRLADLNIAAIKLLVEILGIQKKMLIASEIETREGPDNRLIDLCRAAGCDTYLAGRDGPKYMAMPEYEKSDIKVLIQDFSSPVYQQLFGSFEPNLSVIDLLFNCGEKSIEIIRHGRVSS